MEPTTDTDVELDPSDVADQLEEFELSEDEL